MSGGDIVKIVARIGDDPELKIFRGRPAWCLGELVTAGAAGITSLENPAMRLGHYIFVLRRGGVAIETEYEAHHGPFAGSHGRYRLSIPVTVIETETAGAS